MHEPDCSPACTDELDGMRLISVLIAGMREDSANLRREDIAADLEDVGFDSIELVHGPALDMPKSGVRNCSAIVNAPCSEILPGRGA